MPLKGVIFDWDGVVINSALLHEKSWGVLAEELALKLPPNHFKLGFGKRNEIIIPEILKWTKDPNECQKWGNRKEEIYRELAEIEGIPILDGIKSFLISLQNASIPCVIGTSTEKANLELAFKKLKIGSFFSGAVCSEDVSKGKPDPEVFIKAAKLINQTPQTCVVIEDSTHGIEAAKNGRMKAVGLTTTRSKKELYQKGADLVLSNPGDLNISLLEDLFTS